jgi:hypothetical protein
VREGLSDLYAVVATSGRYGLTRGHLENAEQDHDENHDEQDDEDRVEHG